MGVLVLAVGLLAAEATGATASASAPAPRAPDLVVEGSNRAHVVSLRYDVGRGSAYGLSYLHTWESFAARGGLGVAWWAGAGLEARLITRAHDRLDAVACGVPWRLDLMGDAGGFGLELSAAVSPGPGGVQGIGLTGVFLSAYFVDLGYSYQFPLGPWERPAWLASHQFSLRIQVPVHRYAKTVRTRAGGAPAAPGRP